MFFNFFYFQVLPSEKEIKQNLMNNDVYNEYNLEELESSFKFVSFPPTNFKIIFKDSFIKLFEPKSLIYRK